MNLLYSFDHYEVTIGNWTGIEAPTDRLCYQVTNKATGVVEHQTLSQVDAYYSALRANAMLDEMLEELDKRAAKGTSPFSVAAWKEVREEARSEAESAGLMIPAAMAPQRGPQGSGGLH